MKTHARGRARQVAASLKSLTLSRIARTRSLAIQHGTPPCRNALAGPSGDVSSEAPPYGRTSCAAQGLPPTTRARCRYIVLKTFVPLFFKARCYVLAHGVASAARDLLCPGLFKKPRIHLPPCQDPTAVLATLEPRNGCYGQFAGLPPGAGIPQEHRHPTARSPSSVLPQRDPPSIRGRPPCGRRAHDGVVPDCSAASSDEWAPTDKYAMGSAHAHGLDVGFPGATTSE
ncbi:hypothetical protein DFH09DRAFT_640242 [Mycena vulgaris]|nr:hypothetical protein DFH09DRAFT_640242 [Mycena vulgaris]